MKVSNNSAIFLTNQVRERRTQSLIPPDIIQKSRCSYLNLKPKSHFATPPSSKIISSRPSTGRNLGPGKYLIPQEVESKSFEFNKSPRFSNNSKNLYLIVSALFKKVTAQEKEGISKRIEKNKDFAVLSAKVKGQMAKVRAFQSNIRASVTKLTKQKIYQMNQKKKENVLKEKFKRFDYRMNIDKVTLVVKSWLFLDILVGVSNVVKHLVANKKKLRARSLRLLIWLRAVSRCSGKIQIILRKIQQKRALKKIRTFFLPIIKKWLKSRRFTCKNILVNVLEQQLSTAILTKLIKNWELKMIFIKRSLKNFMFFKYSLYESLLIKWNKTEHILYGSGKGSSGRRRHTVGLKNLKSNNSGCSSIPEELKVHYLRSAVKEIITKDMIEFRIYKSRFRRVHQKNLNNRLTGYLHPILDYPSKPSVPNIYDSFTEEKLVDMINFALKDRANWSRLVNQNQGVTRNFGRYPTQV